MSNLQSSDISLAAASVLAEATTYPAAWRASSRLCMRSRFGQIESRTGQREVSKLAAMSGPSHCIGGTPFGSEFTSIWSRGRRGGFCRLLWNMSSKFSINLLKRLSFQDEPYYRQ